MDHVNLYREIILRKSGSVSICMVRTLRKNSEGELCVYATKTKYVLPSLFRDKCGKKWSKKE